MRGPQPVEATKVSDFPPARGHAASLLRGATGEIGDRLFKFAMLLCGLAVLATLGLIVYELMLRSGPSWHAFGFKFFAGRDWDPVNERFGALPFIYGTLVSSLLGFAHRRAIVDRSCSVHHGDVSRGFARAALVFRGTAGRDSKRGLRTVGNLRAGTAPQQLRPAVPLEDIGLDWIV